MIIAATQALKPNALTIVTVIIFIIASIWIGIYAKKKAKTTEQYFGGTKSFGPMVVALSSAAAIMSAFGFIGGPGFVYRDGFTSIWMTFAAGIAFAFGYWIMGKKMRAMAEIIEVSTLPDIAKIRFKSEVVRGVLAIGILIAAIPYLASQIKGGGILIHKLLGVNEYVAVGILVATLLIYTTISGMAGSILTSAFQGFVMIIGVFGVIIGFFLLTGGKAMEVIQASPKFGNTYVNAIGKQPMHYVFAYFIIFTIGMMGQPAMVSKMYSIEKPRDVKSAGIISGLSYALASLVWLLVGYGALYITASGGESLSKPDGAAFLFLGKMHIVIQALVMAGLLAAILSTSSFFISLATGAITHDLMASMGNEISHDRQIHWGRILTVVVTILAVFFAYAGGDLVGELGALGWGFFASVTIPVFLIGLFWKRTSQEGVIAGVILAILINILFSLFKLANIAKPPFPVYILSVGASIVVTVVVSLFTKTAAGEDLPEEIKPIFKL
mgnify:CR=1 FL=1